MLTLFCSFNLLNVSDNPASGWAVLRAAINLEGFFRELFNTLNEEYEGLKPRNDWVFNCFCCRKEVELKGIAISMGDFDLIGKILEDNRISPPSLTKVFFQFYSFIFGIWIKT